MWNPVSLFKQYCPNRSLSSRRVALCWAVGILGLIASAWTIGAGAAAPTDFRLPGVPAPELARIFTPRHGATGAYQVTVLREGIEGALRQVRGALPPEFRFGTPPGSWQTQRLDPLEAFGTAGTYDRSRLAQLYWGRRVIVARGPIERDGRAAGALTLLSPYPDPTLTRLEPGTLAILLKTGR
jgi:hypothetical protein